MNKDGIDEDALDSEALQAQIDLSMSFAQGLVSSWMSPHKSQSNPRKKDLEKELTDYMRRPPRLGVGASVPEGHQNTAREIARLKGKLIGSKRAREEVIAPKQASDEEGESRTSAIKKKARRDPFDVVHGKKTKKHCAKEPTPLPPVLPTSPSKQSKCDTSNEAEDTISGTTPTESSANASQSTSVESKKQKKTAAQAPQDASANGIDADTSSSMMIIPTFTPDLATSGKPITGGKPLGAFLTTTPSPWSPTISKLLRPGFANIPLLNLSGPASDPESDADHAAPTSPKKKRKRRKKKKSHITPDTDEANTSPKQTFTPTA